MTDVANLNDEMLLAYANDAKKRKEGCERVLSEATAELARRFPVVGTHTLDSGSSFTVSENNTYDEDVIRSLLSPGQIRRVSKTVLDKSVVKRLYADVHAAAKVARGFKVTLR